MSDILCVGGGHERAKNDPVYLNAWNASKVDVFLCPQVRLVSELGKIEASFQELDKMKVKRDVAQYSIEIIELL